MSDKQESPAGYDAYAAFRVPAYRNFVIGLLFVQMGNAAQSIAIGWEVYQRTDSAFLLGMVSLIQAIPMILFTLPAGYLADVYDRRKLVIHANFWTSITSLALGIFSYYAGPLWIMYILLFIDSSFNRLSWPAQSAIMPLLLSRDKFENAVKWQSSAFQVCAMVGPAIGGFILSWSLPATYIFSAITTFIFTGIMMNIKVPNVERNPPGRMIQQVKEGIQFVWQKKILLGTISLDMFAVIVSGVIVLLPMFVKDIINLAPVGITEEQALGWLRAAPAAGALAMALLVAHRPPIRHAGRSMLLAVAAYGVATVFFGLTSNFWIAIGMLALTGAFDNISVVVRQTLVQLSTPDSMRGRVSSVNQVFIGSSNEIGGARAGAMAAWLGPVVSVVSGGVAAIAVVIAWAVMFPKLRKFGALTADTDPHPETDGKA